MKKNLIFAATLRSSLAFAEEAKDDGWNDSFPIESYTMVSTGQNRYWSLKPGRYVVLGNIEPGGGEFVIISGLDETETIDDIETRVIEERDEQLHIELRKKMLRSDVS